MEFFGAIKNRQTITIPKPGTEERKNVAGCLANKASIEQNVQTQPCSTLSHGWKNTTVDLCEIVLQLKTTIAEANQPQPTVSLGESSCSPSPSDRKSIHRVCHLPGGKTRACVASIFRSAISVRRAVTNCDTGGQLRHVSDLSAHPEEDHIKGGCNLKVRYEPVRPGGTRSKFRTVCVFAFPMDWGGLDLILPESDGVTCSGKTIGPIA